MYEIGKFNEMKVVRQASFGYYLDSETGNSSDDVLIPLGSILVDKINIGDLIRVFIYRDSEDRIIATMKEPLITLGEVKKLKVVDLTPSGAFVSMGLERDVFVPKKEQKYPLEVNKDYLFKLYLDKSKRLAATTDVNGALETAEASTFNKNDEVKGTVYTIQGDGTIFVAIDDKYKAVLNKGEYFEDLKGGDLISAKVLRVLEDGRPLLTTRGNLREERLDVKDEIMNFLKEEGGFIPYNDKSTPEEIKDKFKTSKNYFKRALGNLMKEGLIRQDEKGTYLINIKGKGK